MAKFQSNFLIVNKTKGKLPRLPFVEMKNAVLGKSYSLGLIVIGNTLSRKLNFKYRKKNYPTDILSFPLNENEGDIFLNLQYAVKKAPQFDRNPKNFLCFLFIHALAHLKGLRHGSRMESEERKIRAQFHV